MKILTIFLTLLFSSITFGQKLSARDSVVAFNGDDIFAIQEDSSSTYTWRKVFFSDFFEALRDSMDLYYGQLTISNDFTGINTFDGATFNADAHGTVTFNDSTISNATLWTGALYPKDVDGTYTLGLPARPWYDIYAHEFTVINPEHNDSASITFDDSLITISRDVNFTGTVQMSDAMLMDSTALIKVQNFEWHSVTISNLGDTILTLTTSDLYSAIELDLPGNLDPGISNFQIDTAAKGMVLKIYNGDATYDAVFIDIVSGDDNLYMSGNATLSAAHYDYIEFMCVDATKGAQVWMQTGESDN